MPPEPKLIAWSLAPDGAPIPGNRMTVVPAGAHGPHIVKLSTVSRRDWEPDYNLIPDSVPHTPTLVWYDVTGVNIQSKTPEHWHVLVSCLPDALTQVPDPDYKPGSPGREYDPPQPHVRNTDPIPPGSMGVSPMVARAIRSYEGVSSSLEATLTITSDDGTATKYRIVKRGGKALVYNVTTDPEMLVPVPYSQVPYRRADDWKFKTRYWDRYVAREAGYRMPGAAKADPNR